MSTKYLRCVECDAVLKLSIGFGGADWDTEAGEGSDYGWEISLDCTNKRCARVYPIGHIKNLEDFSPVRKELKVAL